MLYVHVSIESDFRRVNPIQCHMSGALLQLTGITRTCAKRRYDPKTNSYNMPILYSHSPQTPRNARHKKKSKTTNKRQHNTTSMAWLSSSSSPSPYCPTGRRCPRATPPRRRPDRNPPPAPRPSARPLSSCAAGQCPARNRIVARCRWPPLLR